MDQGKCSNTIIKRSVMSYIHGSNPAGVDCAARKNTKAYTFTATAVGVGSNLLSVQMAVMKACNNIWASGGEVTGIEAAFLVPATAREIRIKELTQQVETACRRCETRLIGGHTEVTDAVTRPIVTITALGESEVAPFNVKKIKPGMDIIATKWVGLEAAALWMCEEENQVRLLEKLPEDYLAEVSDYADWLTIRSEAAVAMQHGAQAMHDVSDGGIFTALWEVAEGSGCGFDVDLLAIPMRQPTVELMEVLNQNIYRAKSSGCLLVFTEMGEELLSALEKAEIPACIIGQITDKHDKIVHNMDEIRYLEKS